MIAGDDLKFDNLPWMIPPTKMHSSISDLKLDQRFIMSNFSYSPGEVVMDFSVELELTGLGNLMFQYASLRALAESHNATLILPSKTLLRRAFGNFDNKVLFFQPSVIDLYLSENKGHEYTVLFQSQFSPNTCTIFLFLKLKPLSFVMV